jgi:RNA polymerase sigma factor (sigma-70 family)
LEGQAELPDESLPDERALLLKALSKLSPKSRRILELIYVEGLDSKEVQSLLGYTGDAYRTHVHRALNALREALKEQLSN